MAASAAPSPHSGHLPFHRVSVGDHIVVYWDGDRKWYAGEVIETVGDHGCKIHYDDGDCEWVSLDEVKFLLRRDWKNSIRERRNRDSSDQLETIKGSLFDIGTSRYDSSTAFATAHVAILYVLTSVGFSLYA